MINNMAESKCFSYHHMIPLIVLLLAGDYAPFREDMISQFAPTDDGFVSCENDVEKFISLFRSSERQKIIDFIIGSRIRDSGAELGPSTQLGKQIQRRVPLHSHARLETLYSCWVLFWYQSNWDDRDGKSLHVGKTNATQKMITNNKEEGSGDASIKSSSSENHTPPRWLYRFSSAAFTNLWTRSKSTTERRSLFTLHGSSMSAFICFTFLWLV